jgi:hypothetical protein
MSPVTVICLFRVVRGREAAFTDLLKRHWPTLRSLDLVTSDPPRHYRGAEQGGGPLFVEIFSWKSEEAARLAHQHPEVMAIWEPMGTLTEKRDGRPSMEFPHVQPLALG